MLWSCVPIWSFRSPTLIAIVLPPFHFDQRCVALIVGSVGIRVPPRFPTQDSLVGDYLRKFAEVVVVLTMYHHAGDIIEVTHQLRHHVLFLYLDFHHSYLGLSVLSCGQRGSASP